MLRTARTAHSETPPRRSVFSRWTAYLPSSVVLIALISTLYLIVLVLNIITLLTTPRHSLVLTMPTPGEVRVDWLLPGGTLWEYGVRPDDRVLALDQQPPTQHNVGRWSGDRVLVRTTTGDTVEVDSGMIREGRTTWPLLVLSPWFFLLGTLVYLRAPQPAVGRATYALFVSAAFALGLAPASIDEKPVAVAAEFIAVTLFAPCFLLFFLTFPKTRGSVRLHMVLFGPPLVIAILGVLSLMQSAVYELFILLRLAVLLTYPLAGIGLILYAFLRENDHDTRRGLAIVSGGTVASIMPFLLLYVVPVIAGQPYLLDAEYAILPLAIIPASFTYAILRHNILNVPLLQRWLVHALLWLGLILPYTALAYAANWLLASLPQPSRRLVFVVLLVLLVGVSFSWLRDRLRERLDRVIFKDHYDYRAALHKLSQDLSTVRELDALSQSLLGRLCRLMNLDFAVLLLAGRRGPSVYASVGSYQLPMSAEVVAAARKVEDVPEVVPLAYGYLNVLVVPLRTNNIVVGYLCLGPKKSGEPFRAQDRDLLGTISGQIAAVVQNARLLADLRSKVRELDTLTQRLQRSQEEERARLSADIHDEPLQTALHLQRQLAVSAQQDSITSEHIELSQLVINQLRAVCTTMRPAALDDLGLLAALDVLVQEQSTRSGVPIQLDTDAEMADRVLPPATEVVLYRAAQEALTNSLRHAQPRSIHIHLRQQSDAVQLVVEDDGQGFVVPDRFDELVQEGHLGLAGLYERLRQIGGYLDVTSTPGRGTVVQVDVPLEETRA
jgi:two-component system sensor histidine kinase ComP